jgi:hypothetical protein
MVQKNWRLVVVNRSSKIHHYHGSYVDELRSTVLPCVGSQMGCMELFVSEE